MFYEVTPYRSVGGQSGTYELESPWDSPCELILTCISGNGAGVVAIGFDSVDDLQGVISNYATGIPTPGWRGLVSRFNTDSPLIFPYDPVPVENRRVYIRIATDTGGKACIVTGHFRRLAPPDGAYAHSNSNLAATVAMGSTSAQLQEANKQWTESLAEDSNSASAQSYRGTTLRRHNGHKRQSGLLSKLVSS